MSAESAERELRRVSALSGVPFDVVLKIGLGFVGKDFGKVVIADILRDAGATLEQLIAVLTAFETAKAEGLPS